MLAAFADGHTPRPGRGKRKPLDLVPTRCRRGREGTARDRELPSVPRRRPNGLAARSPIADEARVRLPKGQLIVVGEDFSVVVHRASVGRKMLAEESPKLALATGLGKRNCQVVELLRRGTSRHHIGRPYLKVKARHDLPVRPRPFSAREAVRRRIDIRSG